MVIVEPALAERLLLHAIETAERNGDGTAHTWRHRRDAAYQASPDRRSAEFQAVAERAFQELGHRDLVLQCVAAMPRLAAAVRSLRIVVPRGGQHEGADFNRGGSGELTMPCDLTIVTRPERFMDGAAFRAFLLLELEHLEEALDPAFGYDTDFEATGSPNERRMATERLRDLWMVRAANALHARGLMPPPADATLAGLDAPTSADLLRVAARADAPFAELAEAAQDPVAYLEARGIRSSRVLMPSAPCPLCGFPTWEWAAEQAVAAAADVIARELPSWNPAQGACSRCIEAYAGVFA